MFYRIIIVLGLQNVLFIVQGLQDYSTKSRLLNNNFYLLFCRNSLVDEILNFTSNISVYIPHYSIVQNYKPIFSLSTHIFDLKTCLGDKTNSPL